MTTKDKTDLEILRAAKRRFSKYMDWDGAHENSIRGYDFRQGFIKGVEWYRRSLKRKKGKK